MDMKRSLIVIICALIVPIVPFVVVGELPGERWLQTADEQDFRFAVTGGALLAVDVFLPVPSSIVITLLGGRLGFWAGWLTAWLGLTLGNLAGYYAGRLWPERQAPEFAADTAAATIVISRPVPIVAEAVTLACGAARVPVKHMLAASFVGNGIYTLLLALNGTLLAETHLGFWAILVTLLIPGSAWLAWHRWRVR